MLSFYPRNYVKNHVSTWHITHTVQLMFRCQNVLVEVLIGVSVKCKIESKIQTVYMGVLCQIVPKKEATNVCFQKAPTALLYDGI